MEKFSYIIFLLFLNLTFVAQKGNDSTLKANYYLTAYKGYSYLVISFSCQPKVYFCDTCKDSATPRYYKRKGTSPYEYQSLVLKQVIGDKKAEIYVAIPRYIEDIIGMIEKDKMKELAREIYEKNVSKEMVQMERTYNMNFDKKRNTRYEEVYILSMPLKILQRGKITIPKFTFVLSANQFTVEALELEL